MNRFKGGEYMTDSQLRVKMKKSPAEGRRALFDEYCAYVYAIAAQKLRTCASREDIEECVSDVFADVLLPQTLSSQREDDILRQ